MDSNAITALLAEVAAGRCPVAEAAARLSDGVFAGGKGYADLGFAKVDTHRPLRTGEPEVVYGAGKTVTQIAEITSRLRTVHPEHPILITRASQEARARLRARFETVTEDPVAAVAAVGPLP
ncbi:MAG: nickel pincer cofactor biosynthesis protein LarB, partial [Stackebrandtia sp.]